MVDLAKAIRMITERHKNHKVQKVFDIGDKWLLYLVKLGDSATSSVDNYFTVSKVDGKMSEFAPFSGKNLKVFKNRKLVYERFKERTELADY